MDSGDHSNYADVILTEIVRADFVRAAFGGSTRWGKSGVKRVVIRPVEVRGERMLQISRFDGRKDISTNHRPEDVPEALADVLAAGFANVHITAGSGEMDVRLTKKGDVLIGRKEMAGEGLKGVASGAVPASRAAHNRVKEVPLPEGKGDALLAALGILDRNNRVRPTMRDKFTQINEFLKLLEHVLPEVTRRAAGELTILDCGCGASHLTLATAHFITQVKGIPARVVGIDVNPEVIGKARGRAGELGSAYPGLKVEFRQEAIGGIEDLRADIVLALHACDTATDDAIAQAVRSEARLVMAVPCCHQDLNGRLHVPALGPVHHHGILHQRQADLITDAFRALVLKVMGYRAEVIEFISPEHTARNLMIRAVRVREAGDTAALREYQAFKEFTGVVPYLEKALKESFSGL